MMALLTSDFRVKFETLESAFTNLMRSNVLDLNMGGIGTVTVLTGDPDTIYFPITRLPVLIVKVPHTAESPRVAIGNKRGPLINMQLTGIVRAMEASPNTHRSNLRDQAHAQCREFFSNVEAILRKNPKLDGSIEGEGLEYCVQQGPATFTAAVVGEGANDQPNSYMFQVIFECLYRR